MKEGNEACQAIRTKLELLESIWEDIGYPISMQDDPETNSVFVATEWGSAYVVTLTDKNHLIVSEI